MFLTFLPNLTASSPVWVVCIIFLLGSLPIIQAGKYVEANSDFVCLGGIFTINLLIVPLAIPSSFSAKILWWRPQINPSHMWSINSKKLVLQISCFLSNSNLSRKAKASLISASDKWLKLIQFLFRHL